MLSAHWQPSYLSLYVLTHWIILNASPATVLEPFKGNVNIYRLLIAIQVNPAETDAEVSGKILNEETILTHWGRDKMAAFSQTTLSNAFSWMKILEFRLKIHWSFVPKRLINNIPALVLIMAWRRPGDKPLSEPMLVISLTHICITRPQWVNIHFLSGNAYTLYIETALCLCSELDIFHVVLPL